MGSGPKTLNRIRLDIKTRPLALAILVSLAATAPGMAWGFRCEDLFAAVTPPQARKGDESSPKKATPPTAPTAPTGDAIQTISAEELFTFESGSDKLGFKPERKIIHASDDEIQEIVKLAGTDSTNLIGIANEMSFYFKELPIATVAQAFDIVKVRHQLHIAPKKAAQAYKESFDITYHPQTRTERAFPTNTIAGIKHTGVVGLMQMQLKSKTLTFKGIRASMADIEMAFPDAKRLHQLQTLQVFLAMQEKNPSASLTSLLQTLTSYQQNLAIQKVAMGFRQFEETHPSLEDAIMLHILAGRAKLTESQMLGLVEHVIKTNEVKTFKDVAGVIGNALESLDAGEGEKPPRLNRIKDGVAKK